jgi:hypothetical protein
MLTKLVYKNLINKLYYNDILKLINKLCVVCFINLSYHLEIKRLIFYQIYIYFFLTLFFGQKSYIMPLKKDYKRLSLEKGYPLGSKLHIKKNIFYIFTYYFSKWYYYNIFGELKSFIIDKKKGNFFGLKIPFLNLFYLFDYNLVTLFLYNVNIPNFKIFISSKGDRYEAIILKNFFGFY